MKNILKIILLTLHSWKIEPRLFGIEANHRQRNLSQLTVYGLRRSLLSIRAQICSKK